MLWSIKHTNDPGLKGLRVQRLNHWTFRTFDHFKFKKDWKKNEVKFTLPCLTKWGPSVWFWGTVPDIFILQNSWIQTLWHLTLLSLLYTCLFLHLCVCMLEHKCPQEKWTSGMSTSSWHGIRSRKKSRRDGDLERDRRTNGLYRSGIFLFNCYSECCLV